MRVRDRDVQIDLVLDPGSAVEVVSPHGDQYIWTRKQGGVRARGMVRLGDHERRIDARAVVDESAGYHARETAWEWSAGVGVVVDGRAVAWNLVDGRPRRRPRLGAHRVGRRRAARARARCASRPTWRRWTGPTARRSRFHQQAERRRDDNLLLMRSAYHQPFGTFSGILPGGIELREGYGVMERHHVRW